MGLGGLAGFPPQNYNPSNCFQQQGNRTQHNEHNNVSRFPFLFGLQNVITLEQIDDAKNNNGISNTMVVDIPIKAVLVIFLWS